ncbi:GLI pathogenesis-related 2 isoform X2 [Conger conger]|uniref:GLI pathogenesis-related 2 isoform X2 n=1 Tax=Conger conger TaxID=82655 RepID=UPI002A5A9A38|nr:GLI pathogenesis-related 2 isoform X2 [Conger conger]
MSVPGVPHRWEKHRAQTKTRTMADGSFEKEFVDTHNAYRRKHGAPPLTLSRDLCRSAQAWADNLLSMKSMRHSKTNNGENLYYAWSSVPKKLTGKEAVDSWYSEIKDYNFRNPGFQSNTGHFTQVVWKSTTEVGVGLATDGNTVYVVGQYSPAGNISNMGYFEKNVLPAGTSAQEAEPKGTPESYRSTCDSLQDLKVTVPDGSFEKEFVDKHNAYRRKHGAPPLTLSRDLCRSAQAWADHLLSVKSLQHSKTNNGENLYYSWSSAPKKPSGTDAVEQWYSEIKDYNFRNSGFQSKTGHFTQVVWKSTTEVGVGLATDGNTVFVVGQYSPAGNITNTGYFEKNVLPAGTSTQEYSSDGPKGTADEELRKFRKSLVEAQNIYRKQHGAEPLKLCPSLSKEAQDWATYLVSIKTLKNSDEEHGQNFWNRWSTSTEPPTGSEVADAWYKESEKYNFSSPERQNGTDFFTQMVWRYSRNVGIGLATNGQGLFIAVAYYDPCGNIPKKAYYRDNVLAKK